MQTYNKTFLPDSIINGVIEYKPNANLTARMQQGEQIPKDELKNCIQVNVLSNNLKGKTDLHGRPYKPTKWIFTAVF